MENLKYLKFRVWDGKNKKMIFPNQIVRLNIDVGGYMGNNNMGR